MRSNIILTRYTMPAMVIKHEGKKQQIKTRITNLGEIQTALRIPQEAIIRYFKQELDIEDDEGDTKGEWAVKGRHTLEDLNDLLDK